MNPLVEQTLASLRRNHMNGHFAANTEQLLELLAQLLDKGATVGCGDSETLEQCGVFDFLRSGDYAFLDKHDPTLTRAQKRAIYLANFDADFFVTGTNAVTADGKLFNIDGNGSRVAPMLYGPRKVLVVVGRNKIVPTVAEAIERTRQIAAPADAVRLGKDTPCTKLGRCIDCHHQSRICNDFVLIANQFDKDRIHVIVVDEVLGF